MANLTTIFLDRDGVINHKQPEDDYVTSWERFAFLPRVPEAIHLLNVAGLQVIVVTNQRGIARGRMREQDLQEIHHRMREELALHEAQVEAIYSCPHDYGQCDCRKPAIGLFQQAKKDFPEIDFPRAAIIGDSLSDLLPAHELGCKAVLIADAARRVKLLPEISEHGLVLYGIADSLYEWVVRYLATEEVL